MQLVIAFSLVVLCLVSNTSSVKVLLTRQNNACLYGSNLIRNVHTDSNLVWDDSLTSGAEDWAIRLALKGYMEHSSKGIGENLYMTYINTINCAAGLYSWYKDIKNFNYNAPKWTNDDGTFIQQVYDKVKAIGVGQASLNKKLFIVGRYDHEILTNDPMDISHVHKPTRPITKDDLIPKDVAAPIYIMVPIPTQDGWTDWVKTSFCSADCGKGTYTEERWCVRLKDQAECSGDRKRTVGCEKTNCGNCKDLHKDCKAYAVQKKYCTNALYLPWMKKYCMNSCKFCEGTYAKQIVYGDPQMYRKQKNKFIML